jgi:acetyl esterase/lipase
MINWIQGSPLGRKFKALVSHDGTFVADAKISTEELWFMQREVAPLPLPTHKSQTPPFLKRKLTLLLRKFNGTFWDARQNYRRWDPSAPERIRQFATPMLVIHSDKDYRLPVSEGLSLFNVLQERGVPSRFLNFPDENHWLVSLLLIYHVHVELGVGLTRC